MHGKKTLDEIKAADEISYRLGNANGLLYILESYLDQLWSQIQCSHGESKITIKTDRRSLAEFRRLVRQFNDQAVISKSKSAWSGEILSVPDSMRSANGEP